VISVAVRWYLRYGLSYRDAGELLAERGVTVDLVTVNRWVQRFTCEFIKAAGPCRHAPGDRWFVDETYLKVAGKWAYLYRAVDQRGQVIDVLLSAGRDLAAARRFFTRGAARGHGPGRDPGPAAAIRRAMTLFDTLDGCFMNFAYGWAFARPVRKVYYNLVITGLSVAVAFLIGTIEIIGLLSTELGIRGGLWTSWPIWTSTRPASESRRCSWWSGRWPSPSGSLATSTDAGCRLPHRPAVSSRVTRTDPG
jgi:hypothetical protein